jgi:hypothetical protein
MASRVVDKDNGYAKAVETISKVGGVAITVGIHSDVSGEVMEKAEANEFGTDDIPPRPFISGWADERRDGAVREMRDMLAAAIKRGEDPNVALERLALKFAGEIQQRMADGIPPPNAPSTVAQKGSSTPLIDTGELRSSITGKVG